MNKKNLIYWISTGFLAFALVGGGVANVTRSPEMVQGMAHLGYPLYFMTILGSWKLLAAVAILAPGFARLKEWAYAGIFFTFSGALFSHLGAGDPLSSVGAPVVLSIIAAVSWGLRPEGRTL